MTNNTPTQERSNKAWLLTTINIFTDKEVADLSGVHQTQAGRMRRAAAKLPNPRLIDTWAEAREAAKAVDTPQEPKKTTREVYMGVSEYIRSQGEWLSSADYHAARVELDNYCRIYGIVVHDISSSRNHAQYPLHALERIVSPYFSN